MKKISIANYYTQKITIKKRRTGIAPRFSSSREQSSLLAPLSQFHCVQFRKREDSATTLAPPSRGSVAARRSRFRRPAEHRSALLILTRAKQFARSAFSISLRSISEAGGFGYNSPRRRGARSQPAARGSAGRRNIAPRSSSSREQSSLLAPLSQFHCVQFRKREDSNLRCRFRHTAFRVRPIRPLWHASNVFNIFAGNRLQLSLPPSRGSVAARRSRFRRQAEHRSAL